MPRKKLPERGTGNTPPEDYLRARYDRLSLRLKAGYLEKLEAIRVLRGLPSVTRLIETWADEELVRKK